MQERLNYAEASPAGFEAMRALERHCRHGHVPDEIFDLAHRHFNDRELVDLTLAIVTINGWNRLAIAFRKTAGTYQPPKG